MCCRQRGGLIPVIGSDHPVSEFHTGLNHHRHHPLPGRGQSGILKSLFINSQGIDDILWPGDDQVPVVFQTSAWRRHFVSDHIQGQVRITPMARRGFCRQTKCGSPFGDSLGWKNGSRIIGAAGGGVEMNFSKTCGHTQCSQFDSFMHGGSGCFLLPDMGSEVIGADDDPVERQSGGIGKSADES